MENEKEKEREEHPWALPETKLDGTQYGIELATKVAEALEKKKELVLGLHRDYCGTGLTFKDGKFSFCYVNDGYPCDGPSDKCISFDSKSNFVAWLSSKSDFQMGGFDISDAELYESSSCCRGNQRIMKGDLMKFI